jgi:hypothetical protein
MTYKKKEMIAIGQLLKSVDDFEKRVYLNNIPDAKNKERVYVQVRSYAIINKQKTFVCKYVGVKDKYTKAVLNNATKDLKDHYRNHVNQELAAYNCKIEDFE